MAVFRFALRASSKSVLAFAFLGSLSLSVVEAQIARFQASGSTLTRTTDDKLADIVNVKDFGAKCDGSTDDSAAFQKAHDSVPYGTIDIPPGVCVIKNNINITRDNIKWRGMGQGATRLVMGSAVTKLFNVARNTPTQIVLPEFSDFTVDGSQSTQGVAFYIIGARSVHIERIFTVHCYISYFVDQGSLTTSTVSLSKFMIEDTPDVVGARGILLNGGGDAFFIESGRMFQNTPSRSNVGLEILSGGGFMVNNVDISSFGRAMLIDPPAGKFVRFGQFHALQCDSSYGDNAVLDGSAAFASGYPNGIYSLHFVNSWFSSAGVFGGTGNGVNVVSARGIVFDTTQFHSNSMNGIRIQSASNHITVSHSQISGNSNGYGNAGATNATYSGIAVDPGTDTVIITGNVSGAINYSGVTQKYGLVIGAGSANYIVTGNDFQNNLTAGFSDLGLAWTSQVGLNLPKQ